MWKFWSRVRLRDEYTNKPAERLLARIESTKNRLRSGGGRATEYGPDRSPRKTAYADL